ncbi:MAG: hypothetical protein IJ849_08690 [Selenomonadaceae bacterium]|nr:hypothetical protein [Selenomonadaceae bacterium]
MITGGEISTPEQKKFLDGSNFLTQNVTVTRPDGRSVTLVYNDGTLNRLDRLTAANYGSYGVLGGNIRR